MLPTLYDKIEVLPGLGPVIAKKLAAVGVRTVRDLLWYFPYRYEDYSKSKKIAELVAGETVTLIVELVSISARRSFKSSVMVTEAVVKDDTGELTVKWFNQPFLAKTLKEGVRLSLAGTIDNRKELVLVNPHYEVFEEDEELLHTGRIVPVYPRIRNIGLKRLRQAIKSALPLASRLIDPLPEEVREGEHLPDLAQTIEEMHFPHSQELLAGAAQRLKFEELFLHQLLLSRLRHDRLEEDAHAVPVDEAFLKTWVQKLPFALTASQKRAAWEIVQDMAKEHPMHRLLQGDVGSGKTVVAAMAASSVLHAGKQAAYLAPTEILAMQQHASLCKSLGSNHVALVTRTTCRRGDGDCAREDLSRALLDGEPVVVVGTHAVLEESWEFQELALVVVDEQHRFGVAQRHELLSRSKKKPHLLSMTATPIPRSLALTLYGDLDLSLLKEMPSGRQPVSTFVVSDRELPRMYSRIGEEIKKGNRTYVVCALIDPSDTLGVLSVTEMERRLRVGPLRGVPLGVLHGRLKPKEKENVLLDFRSGKTPLLLSTTVVEVGMDVPEATVMYIEGAERFGLAQLHQLRGRVGRSDRASICFLHPSAPVFGTAKSRLEAMAKYSSGFALAELDLKFRGAGTMFGDQQSGFLDFQFATLADIELMKSSKSAAEKLLSQDPSLSSHIPLRDVLSDRLCDVHLE